MGMFPGMAYQMTYTDPVDFRHELEACGRSNSSKPNHSYPPFQNATTILQFAQRGTAPLGDPEKPGNVLIVVLGK